MGLEPGEALDATQVVELAEREGVKAYITGDIAPFASGFRLSARVKATTGGGEPLALQETAANETELIGAVERLGRSLRKQIGESIRTLRDTPALAQVTTSSLPALRAYTAAVRAENRQDRAHGIELAKQALALDSTFAGAWSALFTMYSNNGQSQLATEALLKADELGDRLPEVERLRLEARYAAIQGDPVKEEQAYKRLQDLGRDQVNYGNAMLALGRLEDAERVGREGEQTYPTQVASYWNLAEAQVTLGRFTAAESTLARMRAALPDNPSVAFLEFAILTSRRDPDSTEAFLRSNIRDPSSSLAAAWCSFVLQRGRISDWASCDAPQPWIRDNALLQLAAFRMTGDTARARAYYQRFLTAAPGDRDADQYAGVIALLAEAGQVASARTLLNDWRNLGGASTPGFRSDSALGVGSIAAAESRWDDAIAAFRAWGRARMTSSFHFYNRGLAEAAFAYDRIGQPDSTIALLERAIAMPSISGGPIYESTWYARGLEKLGDLYESRGDRATAADYYLKYLTLLKGADPVLASQVSDVRRKYERVTSEPTRRG